MAAREFVDGIPKLKKQRTSLAMKASDKGIPGSSGQDLTLWDSQKNSDGYSLPKSFANTLLDA